MPAAPAGVEVGFFSCLRTGFRFKISDSLSWTGECSESRVRLRFGATLVLVPLPLLKPSVETKRAKAVGMRLALDSSESVDLPEELRCRDSTLVGGGVGGGVTGLGRDLIAGFDRLPVFGGVPLFVMEMGVTFAFVLGLGFGTGL